MAKKMTRKETIAILQETYPKFNKVAMSMVSHPDRYGVCLTKEAQQRLGITTAKKPKRKMGHQITVRIDDNLYTALMAYCERDKISKQTAIERLLRTCFGVWESDV